MACIAWGRASFVRLDPSDVISVCVTACNVVISKSDFFVTVPAGNTLASATFTTHVTSGLWVVPNSVLKIADGWLANIMSGSSVSYFFYFFLQYLCF